MIKCSYRNILEAAVVSLAAGTEDSSYPLYRLYDRGIGRIFKPTAAETIEVLITVTKTINPSFEAGDFTGWEAGTLCTIQSTTKHSGTYAHKFSPAGAATEYGSYINPVIPVDKSNVYRIRAWEMIENYVAGDVELSIRIYRGTENPESTGFIAGYTLSDNNSDFAWAERTKTIGPAGSGADLTFPEGTTHIGLRIIGRNNADCDHYLDDVIIYEVGTDAADRLLIPAGHNLATGTLGIKHSDDNVTYTGALPQWTAEAGLINKSWTSTEHPYWKFIITNPSYIPQLAELFLTSTYEWELNPKNPLGPMDPLFNVENDMTAGGQDRFLVRGSPKRQRRYRVEVAGETQKQNVSALNDAWGGSKPFWLEDLDGDWIYGKLRSPLNLVRIAYQIYNFDFDFLEVLP